MAKIFDKQNSSSASQKKKDQQEKKKDQKGKKKPAQPSSSKDGDLKMNLIKDEIVDYFDWRKNLVVLIIVVGLAITLVAGSYWGISWWGTYKQEQQIEQARNSQLSEELNNKIGKADKRVQNIEEFEKKLKKAEKVLDKHVYWTNFFRFLEKNTLSQISYSGFSGGLSGYYTLSAHAEDYEAIEAQVEKFAQNKYVNEVSVNSASKKSTETGQEISFDLTLFVDPSIFINYDQG